MTNTMARAQQNALADVDGVGLGAAPADAVVIAVAAVGLAVELVPDEEDDGVGDHQGEEEGDPYVEPQTSCRYAGEQGDELGAGGEDFIEHDGEQHLEGQEGGGGDFVLAAHSGVGLGGGALQALEKLHGQHRLHPGRPGARRGR